MNQQVQLATMDEQDHAEFDNQRDDWQDDLVGEGIPSPTPEGAFLALSCVVAVGVVAVFAVIEIVRILTNG